MHVGCYCVLNEITEATVTIVVIHLGRISWHPNDGLQDSSSSGSCG
jgi:hypothetical protein